MMRKYGVENVNDHFISFNTICDATQVILLYYHGFACSFHKSCGKTLF